jgi:Flp pilus assembly protein CpaB
MRKGRIFIYLALIIILGSVAAYMLLQRNAPAPETTGTEAIETVSPIDYINVVVVTQNTPRGTILDETLLTTIEMPKSDAVDGMFFNDLASVVGRRAKFDLDSGIPLTASMLVDSADMLSTTGSLVALTIPRGMVAVSIPISRLSSVSYAPRPGDHVSVIVTMMFVDIDSEFQTRLPNEFYQTMGSIFDEENGVNILTLGLILNDANELNKEDSFFAWQGRTELDPLLNELTYVVPSEVQRARLVSQTLLPNVTVLQVGDFAFEDKAETTVPTEGAAVTEPVPEPQPTEAVTTAPKPPDVITLIVTPQDAVTLNYLLYSGAELTLALRASGDDSIQSTESATLQFLLDEYNISMPAKLPYGLEPRVNDLALPVLANDEVAPEQ